MTRHVPFEVDEDEEIYLLFVIDEGVLGYGYKRAYGFDSYYYLDGVGYQRQTETDEVVVIGMIEEDAPGLLRDIDL